MEYLISTDAAQTPQGLHLHVRQVSTASSYYQNKGPDREYGRKNKDFHPVAAALWQESALGGLNYGPYLVDRL